MHDDELLAEAVDEAMAPVVDELWAPIHAQIRALYTEVGVEPPPWSVDRLVAIVRARSATS